MMARAIRTVGLVGLCAIVGLSGTSLGAPVFRASVTLIGNNALGESWQTGSDWSDGNPAGPGNDYHVGDSTGKSLRTPNNASSPTFPGDSLTLHATGALGTKHNGTCTIADLRLDGGNIGTWVGNRTMGIGGVLDVQSASQILANGGNNQNRTLEIHSQLVGSAPLEVQGNVPSGYTGLVRLTSNTSTYSGDWTVTSGVLESRGTGSLGGGSATLGDAQLRVNSTEAIAGLTGGGGSELFVGLNRSGSLTVGGGPVPLGTAANRGRLHVGRITSNISTNVTGTLDLSGASSFDAYLSSLTLGTRTTGGSNAGRAVGNVTLAPTNNIDATTILISDSLKAGHPQSTLTLGNTNTIQADTFTIGGRKGNGVVVFPGPGGTLSVGTAANRTDMFIARNNIGTSAINVGKLDLTGGTGALFLGRLIVGDKSGGNTGGADGILLGGTGGSVDVGRPGKTDNLIIGRNTGGGNLVGGSAKGLVDLSGVGTFNATLNQLLIGTASGGGTAKGDLILAANSTIDANTITIADSPSAGQTGHTSTMTLGNANTIHAGTFTIAGRKSNAEVSIVPGGAVQIGDAGNRATLYLARNNHDTGSNIQGTLDLSGGASCTAYLNSLTIGQKSDGGSGTAKGTLILADTNLLDVTGTILVGDSVNAGQEGAARMSTVTLGNTNTILAGTLTVGGRKTDATCTLPGGGTLSLGSAARRANVNVSRNNTGTASTPEATLDASGGTFNAFLGGVVVGHKSGGNTGSSTGNLMLGANASVDADSLLLGELSGTGAAHGIVTMDGGALTTGSLTIGLNGGTGTMTVNGGDVQVGPGGNFYVGRRTADAGGSTAAQALSRLDMSGAANFAADVGTFGIGTVTGGSGSGQTYPTGEVLLAQNNNIVADTLIVADSPAVGLGGKTNQLSFGAANNVLADTVTIGGSKGLALADIAPGGVLNLAGKSGPRADLIIGRQPLWTGGGSTGTLDMTGGTFNALLDEVIIGWKYPSAAGTTRGTLVFEDGAIRAHSILLAHHQGTVGTTYGTLTMTGGVLTADTITLGTGNAAFDFHGGTLAPGEPIGTTVFIGDYVQGSPNAADPAATLQIEMNSDSAFDVLGVQGGVTLLHDNAALEVLLGYGPAEMTRYLIVDNDDSPFDPIAGQFQVDGVLLGEGDWFRTPFGGAEHAFAITYEGGTGNDVEIMAVPEPVTLAAVLAGLAGLGGYVRRRSSNHQGHKGHEGPSAAFGRNQNDE